MRSRGAPGAQGLGTAVDLAARCHSPLREERRHFPAIPLPEGRTTDEQLAELCWSGVRSRYAMDDPVVSAEVGKRLAHELDVIGRTHLAGFFLVCEDLVRFARERGIPAQGRGSAGDSIVAYALGITRVDPIRHDLLFERFINEGRVAYPDIDIDFASSRREEIIQYVYQTYGVEHTGMVANLVTYRARSAVREVGTALGFPRTARGPGREGARDLRLGDGPPRPGGGRRVRGAVPPAGWGLVGPEAAAATASAAGTGGWHGRAGPSARATDDVPRRPGRGRIAGRSDDEGGPGDTPVSEAWIRRETVPAADRRCHHCTRWTPRAACC